jgi:hypothetical protein
LAAGAVVLQVVLQAHRVAVEVVETLLQPEGELEPIPLVKGHLLLSLFQLPYC